MEVNRVLVQANSVSLRWYRRQLRSATSSQFTAYNCNWIVGSFSLHMERILTKYCHLNKFLYIKHHEVIIPEKKIRGFLSWLKTSPWYEEKSRVSNGWGGIPQQECQIQHRHWLRLSRTYMSNRIEYKKRKHTAFGKWPFGFVFRVQIDLWQILALINSKK